jgi:predicted nucleic acid-binding protein
MSAEFIDTNILVYARSAAAKHDSAVELLENEKQGCRSLDLWSRPLG